MEKDAEMMIRANQSFISPSPSQATRVFTLSQYEIFPEKTMPDMDICFVKLCSLSVCGDFCRGVDPGEGATPAPTRADEIVMSRRLHRNILAVTPWQRDKSSASAVPPAA
ncbi:hypothetical protein [Sphingopyxis sp. Root1497]|uniref:hypothetical protein n=1 Tax=Sphingopyxis sp. Root1497 TaxID=1736474 RepID=UPI0012E36E89|nr:hypothetical protein [Sphingopyxis sp. Root1497]